MSFRVEHAVSLDRILRLEVSSVSSLWGLRTRAIMHQQTARRNAKDVFTVDLKVVDPFFATKLLDRLDPNKAIEITESLELPRISLNIQATPSKSECTLY